MTESPSNRRATLRAAFYFLIVWQFVSLSYFVGAQLLGVGRRVPISSNQTSQYLDSLLNPTHEHLVEALHFMQSVRSRYGQTKATPMPRGQGRCQPMNTEHLRGLLLSRPESKPGVVDISELPFVDPIYKEGIEAVARQCDLGEFSAALAELPRKAYPYRSTSRQMLERAATILVNDEAYQALSLLMAEFCVPSVNRNHEFCAALVTLQDDPDDFRAQMHLLQEMVRWISGPHKTTAFIDLIWRTYDDAKNDAERAEAFLSFAKCMGTFPERTGGYSKNAREFGARLASLVPQPRLLQAEHLASLADYFESGQDEQRALALYQSVADRLQGSASWGRCTYNSGYLLRRIGFPAESIKTLIPIFESNVNDMEPGTHLMEFHRNYRFKSAKEIAGAYADMGNFPMSCYWTYLGRAKYRYRSGCGTCNWGVEAELRNMLFWSSAKAGPVFFIGNLVANPLWNIKYWLLVGGSWLGLALLRYIHRIAMAFKKWITGEEVT